MAIDPPTRAVGESTTRARRCRTDATPLVADLPENATDHGVHGNFIGHTWPKPNMPTTILSEPSAPVRGDEGPATAIRADHDFTVTLTLGSDFRQTADFGLPGAPSLAIDEPPPLGTGAGPNPARLLASAVGSCLAASLTFCMRKARIDVRGMETAVRGTLERNERGRLRIGSLHVRLEPIVPEDQHDRVPRCLALFEEFCVVTASVRRGVPTTVEVVPRAPT